jgi:hypothetical protein
MAASTGFNYSCSLNESWLSSDELFCASVAPCINHSFLRKVVCYPPIYQLYEAAQKVAKRVTQSELEILATPPHSIPRNGLTVHILKPNKIQIYIRSNLNAQDALITVILEFGNVLHIEEYEKVFDEAKLGQINKSSFVEKMESIEFLTTQIFDRVRKMLMFMQPTVWSALPGGFDAQQDYLSKQKQTGHVKDYESLYDKLFAQAATSKPL